MIRWGKTPFGKYTAVFVGGVGTWLVAMQQQQLAASQEQRRQYDARCRIAEAEARQARLALQAERDNAAAINQELLNEKAHWANFSGWFKK